MSLKYPVLHALGLGLVSRLFFSSEILLLVCSLIVPALQLSMQRRFPASNGPASGSSPFLPSGSSMADARSVNCALNSPSASPASPPPPPDVNAHAPALDAKAERALQRKQALELKAQRSREYEERWREKCAQDMSEDSWASGWKQPLVQEEYGGWDYTPSPVAASSPGLHEYPSWKRKLQSEQVDRDYKGWDQHMPSSSDDTPLGGWSYPDPSDPFDDYQTEVDILGNKVQFTSLFLKSWRCLWL